MQFDFFFQISYSLRNKSLSGGTFPALFFAAIINTEAVIGTGHETSGRRLRRGSDGGRIVSMELLPLTDLCSLLTGVRTLRERFPPPHLRDFMLC